jgi:hypothetical protein
LFVTQNVVQCHQSQALFVVKKHKSSQQIIQLFWDALTLNPKFYEHTQRYSHSLEIGQFVVFVAAITHGLGSILIPLLVQVSLPVLLLIFLINSLIVVIGYYFWTYTIWQIGQWLKLPLPRYRELLLPIGVAHVPQILNFFTVIPLLGRPIEITLATWSLLVTVVAVNQGLKLN